MKKLLMVFLLALLSFALLADIMSTTYGGNWMNPSTWIGGVIPDSGSNAVIQGPVYVNSTGECLNLNVLPMGMITNPYNEIGQVTVYGNCFNNGQIVDGGPVGEVRLVVLGSIINSQVITCEYVYFAGDTDHSFSSYGTFNPVHFLNMAYANVTFLSDLSLSGTHLYLPHLTLNSSTQSHLSLNGGFMENTNIIGGNGASLNLSNGAHIYNVTADELLLQGTVLISGPVTIGTLYNNGNIYNRNDANYNLVISQRLDNNGTIGNNPAGHYLSLDVGGDLYNYQAVTPQYLSLGSAEINDLWQSPSATPLSAATVNCSGDYRMLSNFAFTGSAISWNSHNLTMHNGGPGFMLSLTGGSLVGVNIDGAAGSTLSMSNNAYLAGVTADEITFNGTVLIGDNVEVDRLINNASLRSENSYPHTLTIYEYLENNGSISNATSGNFFHINLWGDLVNNSQITNYQFTLYGTADQEVWRGNGSNIMCNGGFRICSNIGYALWYFNGMPTDDLYTDFRTVNPSVSGVWNPYSYGLYGKNIIFGSATGALPAPLNVNASLVGTDIKLQWLQVAGAVYYSVYVSDSPDGVYNALPAKAFDYYLGDGIVEYQLIPAVGRKFFRITTGN